MTEPITAADIITAGKATSLTATVLAEWADKGTPKQREYLHGLLIAEQQSRRAEHDHVAAQYNVESVATALFSQVDADEVGTAGAGVCPQAQGCGQAA